MKNRITVLLNAFFLPFILLFANSAQASFISYFKEEDGSTNWQYVANFSSSVLILLLLITLIFLFFNMRKAYKANKALNQIRDTLKNSYTSVLKCLRAK